ncbi:MAG: methylated-DNA/protein-cysteine methyltransferase [Eubacterium sp.]|jgi:methylated-DNA-[protein]-cysteine S-methyltransferase|nr:methylated-DNA/protein-cysteine methyltransferase [Eubacterium sp.]
MKNIFYYDTVIGCIGIAEEDNYITNVVFENDVLPVKSKENHELVVHETQVIREAAQQLDEYLKGERQLFSIPLAPEGTPFMKEVWNGLCRIPYGESRSYKEIAGTVGNPKAYRAVGLANNRNPIPVFIPCHRVIGSNGKLTGYRGGLEVKQKLLELEKGNGNI